MSNHADEEMNERGVSTPVLVNIIFGIVVLIIIAAGYVVVTDKLNGLDAYRTKELRDQRDGYKRVCEENFANFETLKEWHRQTGVKPPPEFLRQMPCSQPNAIDTK